MGKTLIQIYEVQKPEEAESLVKLGVDHVGSVLLDSDPVRNATLRETVKAVKRAGGRSGLIPLLNDPVKIFRALDYYQPDFVHFCDVLSPFPGNQGTPVREYDAFLSLQVDVKDRFPELEIMRSLSIPQPGLTQTEEIQKNILHFVERFAPFSDYFLLDTLICQPGDQDRQPVSGYVGITGVVCDWHMARAIIEKSPLPVILAGGLSGHNVYDAIVSLKPAGVDSCTRTNAVDQNGRPVRFKKDMEKVRRFIEEARRADKLLGGGDFAADPIDAEGI